MAKRGLNILDHLHRHGEVPIFSFSKGGVGVVKEVILDTLARCRVLLELLKLLVGVRRTVKVRDSAPEVRLRLAANRSASLYDGDNRACLEGASLRKEQPLETVVKNDREDRVESHAQADRRLH